MEKAYCSCAPQSMDVVVLDVLRVESLHSGLHSVTAHSACSNKWIPHGSIPKGAEEEGDEWWQYIQQVLEGGEDGKTAEDGPVRNLEGHGGHSFSEPISYVTDVKVVELNHHGEPITHEHLHGEWGHGINVGTVMMAGSALEAVCEQQLVDMASEFMFTKTVGVSTSGHQMISTCGWRNDMTCGETRRLPMIAGDELTSLVKAGPVSRAFESVCPVVESNPTPETDYFGLFVTWVTEWLGGYGGRGQ